MRFVGLQNSNKEPLPSNRDTDQEMSHHGSENVGKEEQHLPGRLSGCELFDCGIRVDDGGIGL